MDIVTILVTIQWVGIGVSIFELIYTMFQKPSEMQRHIIVLTTSMILMLTGYLMEIGAHDLQAAYYGTIISYMGQPFALLSAFMLICVFYGKKISTVLLSILAMIAVFIPVAVATNKYHHQYYIAIAFDESAWFSPLVLEHGPLYYCNAATCAIFFIASIYVIIIGNKESKSLVRKKLSLYSVLMVVCGTLGYLIYFLDLVHGYDTTMTGIFFSSLSLFILFFKCRIFDVVDIAKDYALDISDDGLIVYDDGDFKVYENAAAKKITKTDISPDYVEMLTDEETIFKVNDKVYSIGVSTINKKNDYIGKSVEIKDITQSYNYQSRLEKAVKDTTERLATIQRTIFGSMASIVEARSLETGDHIRRVGEYVTKIVNVLKNDPKFKDVLTEEYINTLVLSTPLHDLGKISISDTILLKPGKLNDEEFEIMKRHAPNGAQIIETTMSGLESEEYINMARDIALYHHERWDGTGYPKGLAGEQIPLSARIVALADCYDALTSERCYKPAFSEEKAIEIILEESGTHFDPDIVNAFMEH